MHNDEISSSRYRLIDAYLSVLDRRKEIEKTGFIFDSIGCRNAYLRAKSKLNSLNREIKLELKHKIIQTKFLNYLQNKYGKEQVKLECKAFGASRIDITRKTDSEYAFIK